ncbi:bacteriocin-protection protein [Spirosoma sp. KCTC 42546]|uniref:YdeI/OmpD-associated family protein n=1 Tax=Spirosoma sp. KCTC 42546 TaxID=2520506 RepID=UPI00115C2B61|nr:YdeI/OmpD-associated family protein [Spirosoma sp. KCTC 42546]QDK82010.1 bacteriocin-protection protein [Spirosoma sp. KCTC 42546]
MTPTFFATQAGFRDWLTENHDKATELLVGFYKVGSGKPSMTWSQSVDEALCFGWIDGVRRSVDPDSYCIRFTPRKSKSIWSAVNIAKIDELSKQGLMQPAGLAAFAKRQESKSKIYAYEQQQVSLSDEFEAAFKANELAWAYFQKQAPSYRKVAINWVMSAKQAETVSKRLNELISDSAQGQKIKSQRY